MDTKNKLIKTNAIIINETDYNEYDKLFTLLSEDFGKISVYAFGIRRQNSRNLGKARIFTFGTFELKLVKDSYQLDNIILKKSFEKIISNYEYNCYASYFIELVDYFILENMESKNVCELLYYTFKAINDEKMDLDLIRLVFELKILQYQGLYKGSDKLLSDNKTLIYTWGYVLKNDPRNLYNFNLDQNIYKLFKDEMKVEMREKVDKKFKTLENLNYI